jgi:hypothetical protein
MIVAFLVLNKFLWEINLDFRTTNEIEPFKKPFEVLEDSTRDEFKTKDFKTEEMKTLQLKDEDLKIAKETQTKELKLEDFETFEKPKIDKPKNEEIKIEQIQTGKWKFKENIKIEKSKPKNENASMAVSFGLGRLGNQVNIHKYSGGHLMQSPIKLSIGVFDQISKVPKTAQYTLICV